MRPIKFRCWNGEKFVNVAAYARWKRGILVGNYNVIFEQFTGLNDSTGKEIYESDIIKNPLKDLFEICWAMKDMDYHGFVCRHLKSNTRSLFISSDFRSCEIIGNIHENPELLETK
jgi:uncharacterized phage protein (TIGR01671 family)